MTVRQVLAHTAGLTENWFPGYAARELAAQVLTPQVPGGFGLGTEFGDGRFGHTGQNTGYSCFSFAWPASGTAVAVMTNAEDCHDTLLALIQLAGRHYG